MWLALAVVAVMALGLGVVYLLMDRALEHAWPPELTDDADEHMAPLREPHGRHARRDVTEGRIRLAHTKVRRALEGRRKLP